MKLAGDFQPMPPSSSDWRRLCASRARATQPTLDRETTGTLPSRHNKGQADDRDRVLIEFESLAALVTGEACGMRRLLAKARACIPTCNLGADPPLSSTAS
jgi:hypothetical protein